MGAPVFLIGLAIIIAGWIVNLGTRRKAGAARAWPQARGRIITSDLVHKVETDADNRAQDIFYVRPIYAYEVDGRALTGDRVRFGATSRFESRRAAEALATRYCVGRDVVVLYNPRKPQESALESGRPDFVLPIVLTLVGGFIAFIGLDLL